MKWEFNICNIKGIPVRVHVSFLILLPWIAYMTSGSNTPLIYEIFFLLSIFACVLLHELGHALTALKFNIKTRDIVLYPFGGIASLLGEAKPSGELLIAIAGPLVNFAIALVIFPFLNFPDDPSRLGEIGFIEKIFLANLVLAIFNLLPAFPMDGGRILRASLALLKVKKATLIAARISQALSLLLLVLAFYTANFILMLVSIFVFSAASREASHESSVNLAADFRVKDVMTEPDNFKVFTHGMTIHEAAQIALTALQRYFPVVHGSQVLGIVSRDELIASAALMGETDYVSSLMQRSYSTTVPGQKLVQILQRISSGERDPFLVMDNDSLVGMVFREKLLDFLMYHKIQN